MPGQCNEIHKIKVIPIVGPQDITGRLTSPRTYLYCIAHH